MDLLIDINMILEFDIDSDLVSGIDVYEFIIEDEDSEDGDEDEYVFVFCGCGWLFVCVLNSKIFYWK